MSREWSRMMTQKTTKGLCKFSDPDLWFRFEDSHEAIGICGNCPVRLACARAALDLGATDGVWAGVRLPGVRIPEDLEAAHDQLRRVVVGLRYEPAAHRARALAIREAVEYTAARRDAAVRAAPHRRAAAVRAAMEPAGA